MIDPDKRNAAFTLHQEGMAAREISQRLNIRDLVNELYASIADHSQRRVLKRYVSYDCLLIDEVGYAEVEPAQVSLFFTLLHKRHKVKPTLITTNLGFSDWKTFLKNENLTSALIDRLTSSGQPINMRNCKSLRIKSDIESDSA